MKIINGRIFTHLCHHFDDGKNTKNNSLFNLLLWKPREGKLGAKCTPFSYSLVAIPEVFTFLPR